MIALKYSEIKKLPKEDIDKKLNEMKTELMKLNAQVATGTTPKSTKQIREIKKNIARIETLRSEEFRKELASVKSVPKPVKARKYKHH